MSSGLVSPEEEYDEEVEDMMTWQMRLGQELGLHAAQDSFKALWGRHVELVSPLLETCWKIRAYF